MAWMLSLMAFPPGLLLLVRMAARNDPPDELVAILVFVLSACVASMMSVFLWATPALSSELEGRSWVYLAVRPYGPIAVLIGKYIVSVSWAIPVGVVSATLSVLVFATDEPIHLIAVQCGLVVLSCLAYSALFLLIGVIAPKIDGCRDYLHDRFRSRFCVNTSRGQHAHRTVSATMPSRSMDGIRQSHCESQSSLLVLLRRGVVMVARWCAAGYDAILLDYGWNYLALPRVHCFHRNGDLIKANVWLESSYLSSTCTFAQ
jgi:hypothetical protein